MLTKEAREYLRGIGRNGGLMRKRRLTKARRKDIAKLAGLASGVARRKK